MWCRNCQQDVPASGSTEDSAFCCARCHQPFTTAKAKAHATSADWVQNALRDDWEFEDELNDAERLVASLGVGSRSDAAIRVDAAHVPGRTRESTYVHPSTKAAPRQKPAPSFFFSWCMLSLGMMAFVFGAVLIGWSIAEDRPELWRLGLPFTLGGQAALIVGLVFQLDGLWRSNRDAAESLGELDSQLDELRHATSLLSTTHSNSAKSFYMHMAEGASPHLLLADLKGQLDLLATRMSDGR